MGTLGGAAPWHPLFRFCCWLPPVLLGPHTGHTLLGGTPQMLLADPSLTLTSRHYLVRDLDQLSITLSQSLIYHWYLEDVSKADIESLRDATIITTIEVEADFIPISTSDADNPEQENTVIFTPGETHEIINPLNGENVEFVATVLSPTMIQIRSEGVDSGTIEIKTWTFMPEGAMVNTEVLRDNQLFPVVSDQVMARVDDDNKERSLVLGWLK